jgi:hypothetical protein
METRPFQITRENMLKDKRKGIWLWSNLLLVKEILCRDVLGFKTQNVLYYLSDETECYLEIKFASSWRGD